MARREVVRIRTFRYPDDYEKVRELWLNAGEGISLGRSDTSAEIKKKTHQDPDLFLVAEGDRGIIGSVIGGYDGRRGLIYHLAVEAAHRNRGIGKMLMQEVENRLRAKGCLKCYLMVLRGNEIAARFYEKRGWSLMEAVALYGKEL
jgi:ribosomal protein S18 acetylase RimI-like enzyme